MLASAVGTQLLAASALDGAIDRAALLEGLELMRRPSVQAAVGVRAVARCAGMRPGSRPDTAGRWLVHAERTVAALDSELWPESVLRDETLAVLGIEDVDDLRDGIRPLDHAAALAQAITWLGQRDPGERSARSVVAAPLTPLCGPQRKFGDSTAALIAQPGRWPLRLGPQHSGQTRRTWSASARSTDARRAAVASRRSARSARGSRPG